MAANTQDAGKSRFYAGFYWRTPSRTRFWGWGNPSAFAVEQPWAMVADWLRLAHSLAGSPHALKAPDAPTSKALTSAEEIVEPVAVPAFKPAPEPPAARTTSHEAQREKRKMRFVWDRHFIGLVYR